MAEIIILGDICPRWGNGTQFDTGNKENVFHTVLSVLNHADFVAANLEAPITESEERLQKTSMNLKANPRDLSLLKDAGIDAFSLANNHILDYGVTGLKDTISYLGKNALYYYGAGKEQRARETFFTDVDGVKIGFLSFAEREFNCAVDYGIGANLWDDLISPADIRKAKENCDFLIVQYHGGIEEYSYPSPLLQKKCRAMADAGADFITCQHSHCIGTREKWNESEILYGQGNSIFGYSHGDDRWNNGLMVKITLNKEKKEIKYIPIEARKDGEYLMEEAEANALLTAFEDNSRKIIDKQFVVNEWNTFCTKQKNTYFALLLGWSRVLNKLNRVLGGRILKLVINSSSKRAMMNIIRCDAHREVMQTVLEEDVY